MEKIGVLKTIDGLGRLQIPKEIRDRLSLQGEVELLITADGLLVRASQYVLVKKPDMP